MMSLTRSAGLLLATALTGFLAAPSYAGYAMPAPETMQVRDSNWYLNGFLGLSNLSSIKDKQNDLVYKFKTKYDYGMAIGYRASNFRFEAQYTLANSRFKSIKNKDGSDATPSEIFARTLPDGVTDPLAPPAPLTAPGNVAGPLATICTNTNCSQEIKPTTQALMGNVYYDFQGPTDVFGYYVGLGFGFARYNAEYDVYNANHVSVTALQKETKFAYQVLVGMTVSPDGPFSYDIGYRYLTSGKLENLINGRPVYHLLNVGITYDVPVKG